ncbi:uncharacterized protein [Rutidosis leptorrhynchoides]|uniref:uncharacterized protein n=1 Tax=Rutidosis leptorrhynchoides TaxID=125765 RepID=UPI003A9A6539
MSRIVSNHTSSSCVWLNIIATGALLDDSQVAFSNSFVKKIGCGNNASFWTEHWISQDKLSTLFPRLYRLESNPDARVQQRIQMGSADTIFSWNWIRVPSGCTASELNGLQSLLSSAILDQNMNDTWPWAFASNGLFSVKKLTSIIEEQNQASSSQQGTMRNKLALKKVEVFICRTQLKRLPVKIELDKRGIDLHSVRCPVCDDDLESLDHALVSCKHAKKIWDRIHKWWNLSFSSPFFLEDLISLSRPVSCNAPEIWQALKWIGLYCIWKNCNNLVFKGKPWSAPMIFNEIQSIYFLWMSNRVKEKCFDWLTWLSNPSLYLIERYKQ